MLGGEAAFCQGGAHLVLGVGGKLLPDLLDAGGGVSGRHLLLEVSDVEVISQRHPAAEGRRQPQDAL